MGRGAPARVRLGRGGRGGASAGGARGRGRAGGAGCDHVSGVSKHVSGVAKHVSARNDAFSRRDLRISGPCATGYQPTRALRSVRAGAYQPMLSYAVSGTDGAYGATRGRNFPILGYYAAHSRGVQRRGAIPLRSPMSCPVLL
eukprot:2686125-Rhodomonas_salina.1